jgi:ABC-type Fe3+-hydroxamate transport system substrate-binding protein
MIRRPIHQPQIGGERYSATVTPTIIAAVATKPTTTTTTTPTPKSTTTLATTPVNPPTKPAKRFRAGASKIEQIRTGVGTLLLALSCWAITMQPAAESAAEAGGADRSYRLVSLNPSLTAIVLRLGAGDTLVGVDDYSARLLPELAELPRVGGLFDPGLESIVSLRPDRVLLVAGVDQQTHATRLAKLGLEVEIYRNERLDEVLENIERLGALLDRQPAASERIRAILAMREAVALTTKRRKRPDTVAIVDRSPLYVVGGETFLDELLHSVGAKNLGRQLAKGYPRASIEWLISSRPELLLDLTPGATAAADFWSRWPSIPAVSNRRVVDVDPTHISLPGPDLDRALRELAVAVHGEAIEAEIARAMADRRAQDLSTGPSGLDSVDSVRVQPRVEESARDMR